MLLGARAWPMKHKLLALDEFEAFTAVEPETAYRFSRRILVAEDSEAQLLLIRSYLKGSDYEIEHAANGEVAIQKFQSGDFALVLMDVQMPVMGGYAATRAIREWETKSDKAAVPILALTADVLTSNRRKSIENGCSAHLNKPIDKLTLLTA